MDRTHQYYRSDIDLKLLSVFPSQSGQQFNFEADLIDGDLYDTHHCRLEQQAFCCESANAADIPAGVDVSGRLVLVVTALRIWVMS